jgi:hypothetical protein
MKSSERAGGIVERLAAHAVIAELPIRKGRAYKHPLTGKSIDVADKETIIFKPSDQLIEDTNPARARRRKPARPNNLTAATDDILFKG